MRKDLKDFDNLTFVKAFFNKDEYVKISKFIYETLDDEIDSQIFVEDSIVKELKKSDILKSRNYETGYHYEGSDDPNGVEKTYDFNGSQIYLVHNCKGYFQVSYFASTGIKYTHYKMGMKQVVIICSAK